MFLLLSLLLLTLLSVSLSAVFRLPLEDTVKLLESNEESARFLKQLSFHRRSDNATARLELEVSGERDSVLATLKRAGVRNWREVEDIDYQQYLVEMEKMSSSSPKRAEEVLQWGVDEAPKGYHNYNKLKTFVGQVRDNCKNIAKVYSIGKSFEDRELYVVRITKDPNSPNDGSRPQFKYVGNMHGDEVVGREMLINLIHHMCLNYGSDKRITDIVDNLDTHILITMNPDGFERGRRSNGRGVDLNRNFPDQYTKELGFNEASPPQPSDKNREPETQALMKFSRQNRFLMSANLHGGSVVANYPFDGNTHHRSGRYTATPDDAIFKRIAKVYASANPEMKNSREFHGGITNGASWYVLYGGMQDWNYLWLGDLELTLELSYRKWPPAEQLPSFWKSNKDSLLNYMAEAINLDFKGRVLDADTGAPLDAKVFVVPSTAGHWVMTNPQNGWYHRAFIQGTTATLKATAQGYASQTAQVDLTDPTTPRVLDFHLSKSKK